MKANAILGREPMLYIAAITAIVSIVGTFGLHLFTAANAAAAVIVINVLAAAAAAWTTRPIAPGVFSAVISAIIALGLTYGLTVPAETVMAINAALVPILMLLTRGQVSSVETAVTSSSLDPTPEAARKDAIHLARKPL